MLLNEEQEKKFTAGFYVLIAVGVLGILFALYALLQYLVGSFVRGMI